MSKPESVTDKDFAEQVLASKGDVIVDFWATWCGPCRMVAPVLEELGSERPALQIKKLDTDANPAVAGRFGVRSIPTLILFRDGKEAKRVVGYQEKKKLIAAFGLDDVPAPPTSTTA